MNLTPAILPHVVLLGGPPDVALAKRGVLAYAGTPKRLSNG